MVQSSECEQPRITVKRDIILPKFSKDVTVSAAELPAELDKRMVKSSMPITLKYQYRQCWNMTLFDTPGLAAHKGDPQDEDTEAIIAELSKVADNRLLIFVEVCREWADTYMLQYAEKIDARGTRSTFIYSQLSHHLHNMSTAREFTNFISGRPPAKMRTFFLSQLSTPVREKCTSMQSYIARIQQTTQRDFEKAQGLKYENK
jgi:hypothetical protein